MDILARQSEIGKCYRELSTAPNMDAERWIVDAAAEIERLRAKVETLQQFEPVLTRPFDPANVTIRLAQGFMSHLVQAFDAMNGDANYTVTTAKTAGGGEYEVTVRRTDKPTPHDLRAEAERKLADARAEIEQLRYELAEANKTCEEVDEDNKWLRQQLQTLASSPKPLKPLIPEYKFSDPNKPWSGETVKGTRKKKRRSSDERA